MQQITLNEVIRDLAEYNRQTGNSVDLLIVGGLALQAYGFSDRITVDVGGEFVGELDPLITFFQQHRVPADLGENMSVWHRGHAARLSRTEFGVA